MQAIINFDDLRMLRIAARRWAIDNPHNPNAERVHLAVGRCHAAAEWILTDPEKRRPTDRKADD